MSIAVGFGCLVAVAVLGRVTGLPGQHLRMEEHPVEQQLKMEDPAEVPEGSLRTIPERSHHSWFFKFLKKHTCDFAGGQCQPKGTTCNGSLKEGPLWCRRKSEHCCIPRGCTFGSATFKNGSYLDTSPWDNCAKVVCHDGHWDVFNTDCVERNITCQCDYNHVHGGCILGEPNIPHLACRCTHHIDGDTGPHCTGQIVNCVDPTSFFCTTPGAGEGHCLQGQVSENDSSCHYDY